MSTSPFRASALVIHCTVFFTPGPEVDRHQRLRPRAARSVAGTLVVRAFCSSLERTGAAGLSVLFDELLSSVELGSCPHSLSHVSFVFTPPTPPLRITAHAFSLADCSPSSRRYIVLVLLLFKLKSRQPRALTGVHHASSKPRLECVGGTHYSAYMAIEREYH